MAEPPEDEVLGTLRRRADRAEDKLQEAVRGYCLGPHIPVQHRDKQPPWCERCGRTLRGVLIRKPS